MHETHALLLIAVIAAVTALLRFAPFAAFSGAGRTPAFVVYLGGVLPPAMIGMLTVYCLRNVELAAAPHGLPELAACAAVVLLHLWKRNTLVSIVAGTAVYMVLVQTVL